MTVEMKNAESDFSAGQFFNLKVIPRKNSPLLRRPFAPSEVHAEKMSFVYAVVGSGTEEMTKLKKEDEVEILYPLGNGFTIPKDKETNCLLVGGGCGAPSMLALAMKLKKKDLLSTLRLAQEVNAAYLKSQKCARQLITLRSQPMMVQSASRGMQ